MWWTLTFDCFLVLQRGRTQSHPQSKACTIFVDKKAQYKSITLPPVENAASEDTMVMGMESMSDAIFERIQNFRLLAFHHSKASKSKSESSAHKKYLLPSAHPNMILLVVCYRHF